MSDFTMRITPEQADQLTRANLQEALVGVEKHLHERQQDACAGSETRHAAVFDTDPETDVHELTKLRDSMLTVLDWM